MHVRAGRFRKHASLNMVSLNNRLKGSELHNAYYRNSNMGHSPSPSCPMINTMASSGGTPPYLSTPLHTPRILYTATHRRA